MILGIKTDQPLATVVLCQVEGSSIDRVEWEAGRQLSATLLEKIETILKKHQITWDDLSAIVVYEGPGSFTGLRIGITVGNTIAFEQDIPIVGSTGDHWFEAGVKKIGGTKFTHIVVPEYGGEANITKPRK